MKNLVLALIAILGIVAVSSVFVIPEGERGIVIRFGKIQRDDAELVRVFEPGLHFKVPLIENVRKLDARIQTLADPSSDRFVTAEKKDLLVDSYVKWRIADFGKYFLSTGGNLSQAEVLLKQYINNGLRTVVASKELGIDILDVRVKKINLPDEISNSIFQRMRAERTAVAKEHRSRGMEQSEIIKADVDARVTIMVADAERNSRTVRGEGDASAAKVYADVYSKNGEFYSFVRSLEAYKNSFQNNNDVMVIQPDNDFFKYMKSDKVQN
jgi:membrane protease subunit HflC